MSQRKSSIYNLINNPLVYKIIQKVMSGTSLRANIVRNYIKKKKCKNSRYRVWTSRNLRKYLGLRILWI